MLPLPEATLRLVMYLFGPSLSYLLLEPSKIHGIPHTTHIAYQALLAIVDSIIPSPYPVIFCNVVDANVLKSSVFILYCCQFLLFRLLVFVFKCGIILIWYLNCFFHCSYTTMNHSSNTSTLQTLVHNCSNRFQSDRRLVSLSSILFFNKDSHSLLDSYSLSLSWKCFSRFLWYQRLYYSMALA